MLTEKDLAEIDTRQGTDSQSTYSNGNCLPYTGVPYGMNYIVAQTTHEKGSWFFHPNDATFQGFRLTHQPSPWIGDFSSFLLTPVVGEPKEKQMPEIQSSYRQEESIFAPHYNKIKQEKYQITSEIVPTMYGGILQSTYQFQEHSGLIFQATGLELLNIDNKNNRITGKIVNFSECEDANFTMYVVLEFSQPFSTYSLFNTDGHSTQIYVDFGNCFTLETRFATSFLSIEQALDNLKKIREATFLETKKQSANVWLDYLNRIEVEDDSKETKATFYTCLYRCFLFPQTFYEVDKTGVAYHYDTHNQCIKKGKFFTNNGFWDTAKTVYPLLSIIAPSKLEDMLEGFFHFYQNTGYLPKWLSPDERGMMPGTLIDSVIADASIKEIGNQYLPEFLKAMLKGAEVECEDSRYGRRGVAEYEKLGYVPAHYRESVNHTQDYAYSDFCIAQVAQKLGETSIANTYYQKAQNYRHIFDKETRFMRGKTKHGEFLKDFHPFHWGRDYTEGSAWQNSFSVYHDIAGLIELHGGKIKFLERLIELCNTPPYFREFGYGMEIHEMSEMAAVDFGQLAISNHPSFHLPYLFMYVNQPAYTQYIVKRLKDELFAASWKGFPGDEDNGSMSAWYIFSSLGFYPVCPGTGQYVFGHPSFRKVCIHLENGKEFIIQQENQSANHLFVEYCRYEGERMQELFLTHEQIQTGGNLQFVMNVLPPLPSQSSIPPYSLKNELEKL